MITGGKIILLKCKKNLKLTEYRQFRKKIVYIFEANFYKKFLTSIINHQLKINNK